MDVEEFDAINKDGAKQVQLSRLITRFDAKYQDYYAPVNCLIPGGLVAFFGGVLCVFFSFMFPGFWDRDFVDNFGFNGFTTMWGIYLFLVVFVTIRGFQKGQKLKQEFLRHHAPPSEEEIKEWKRAKEFFYIQDRDSLGRAKLEVKRLARGAKRLTGKPE